MTYERDRGNKTYPAQEEERKKTTWYAIAIGALILLGILFMVVWQDYPENARTTNLNNPNTPTTTNTQQSNT